MASSSVTRPDPPTVEGKKIFGPKRESSKFPSSPSKVTRTIRRLMKPRLVWKGRSEIEHDEERQDDVRMMENGREEQGGRDRSLGPD